MCVLLESGILEKLLNFESISHSLHYKMSMWDGSELYMYLSSYKKTYKRKKILWKGMRPLLVRFLPKASL